MRGRESAGGRQNARTPGENTLKEFEDVERKDLARLNLRGSTTGAADSIASRIPPGRGKEAEDNDEMNRGSAAHSNVCEYAGFRGVWAHNRSSPSEDC